MFIAGLIVGPALGLFAGHYLFLSGKISPRIGVGLVALVVATLLVAGFVNAELRLGLATGIAVGVLLAVTPIARALNESDTNTA